MRLRAVGNRGGSGLRVGTCPPCDSSSGPRWLTTIFVDRRQMFPLCARVCRRPGRAATVPTEHAQERQCLGGALSETPETKVCRALDHVLQGRWPEGSCTDSLHTHRPSATAEVDFHKPPVAFREALALDLMRPLAGTLLARSAMRVSRGTRVGPISRWKRLPARLGIRASDRARHL